MNSWILLHTHSVMAYIIGVTQIGMFYFLMKSRDNLPVLRFLKINYFASFLWYLDQMIRFSLYPGTEGSFLYKIETIVVYGPVIIVQMYANFNIFYLFLEEKFPKERRIVNLLFIPFAIVLEGGIAWNEIYNDSHVLTFQTISFIWGMISFLLNLSIAIRKAFTFKDSNSHAYYAHLVLSAISICFISLSIVCVIYGLFSPVGYWTYFILVWAGELGLILTYLYFSNVFVSFQVKITGYSFVSVVVLLTILTLFLCPPVMPDLIEQRMKQQQELKNIFVILFTATLLTVTLLPLILRRTLTIPLKQLLRAIKKVNSGNLNVQVPLLYNDEIGLITTNFNRMTVTLRQAKERLEEYTHILGELYNNQQKVQEQTLNHVSQEIHDNVGQLLSLVRMQLNQVAEKEGTENQLIADAQENIGRAMRDLRDMARGMSSDRIRLLGLFGSVEQEAQRIQRSGSCEVVTQCEGSVQAMDHQKELILFRVIQESLQNVFKHAGASRINIFFNYQPHLLQIEVQDNGKGFIPDKEHRRSGLGLMNMQHRVQLTGGELLLDSKEGKGTTVIISIPMV